MSEPAAGAAPPGPPELPPLVDPALLAGLGPALRRKRRALGLRQKEVAAALGVHRGVLFRIERGKSLPAFEVFLGLCALSRFHLGDFADHLADYLGRERVPRPGALPQTPLQVEKFLDALLGAEAPAGAEALDRAHLRAALGHLLLLAASQRNREQ